MLYRLFTSSVVAAAFLLIGTAPARALTLPVVSVEDIDVVSVVLKDGGLVANTVVTLDVAGQTVTRNLEIPLNVAGSPGSDPACDILNLSISPIHLDLLGLVVDLDNCDGGPVTVDLTGVPGDLLGDLLCSVAGLLNDGGNLGTILGGLTGDQLTMLTEGIRDALNRVFDGLLNPTPLAAAHQAGHGGGGNGGGGHRCDILNLELEDGVHLDLLGLAIDTSGICLDVYAERGQGNLLGNLLCSLTGLLDRGGNTNIKRLLSLVGDIRDLLELLDLADL
jgi:hypothetical protein